jgi:homocysteine S-methyltransferase
MNIKEYLKEHQLIADGSMGTYYSSISGVPGGVSEKANLTDPDTIKHIHTEYLSSGARLLRTNTFAANRIMLRCDIEEQTEIIKTACELAKACVAEWMQKGKETVWLLGDIGPIPEDSETCEQEILAEYQLICDLFIEAGLDGIHFETFASMHYIEKLVPYIKNKAPNMFVMTSFCVNKNGYTAAGIRAERILDRISSELPIDACGLNCGVGSGHMLKLLQNITLPADQLIYISPNAGYPEQMQNRMVFMDNARYFSDNMEKISELGVDILGGCCGTTPEYIALIVDRLQNKSKPVTTRKVHITTPEESKPVRENEFYRLMNEGKKVIAVELDPPYDANIDHIMECAHAVKKSGVDVITFADSPMGRSRVDSLLMGIKIAEEAKLTVMPHLCCRDRNMISMRSVLLGAYIHGIRNLLLVTGDPVPGESRISTTAVFDYNSIQLMDYVKEMNTEHFATDPICYGGALNHGRGMIDKIVERMQRKIDAGCKYFLTQPIYSREDAGRIRQIKERVDTKILCGIMPLVSYRNACFIRNEMGQINIPEEIIARYRADMTREEAENVGAAIAREVIEFLEPVADGYYFMLPFNRVSLLDKILR